MEAQWKRKSPIHRFTAGNHFFLSTNSM